MKPHKYAEVIKAWADGHMIQYLHDDGEHEPWWVDITGNCVPWDLRDTYRIKPAEKVVRWLWVSKCIYNGRWYQSAAYMTQEEAEDSFRDTSITQYKKLKWSREEFDE